jgi:hypothetical protein
MIPLMKKNASKEEQVAWAKTQAAYEAGFRYVPEAHKEDCNCDRKYAVKSDPERDDPDKFEQECEDRWIEQQIEDEWIERDMKRQDDEIKRKAK